MFFMLSLGFFLFSTLEIGLFKHKTTSSKRVIFSSITLDHSSRFSNSPSFNKTSCAEYLNSCNFSHFNSTYLKCCLVSLFLFLVINRAVSFSANFTINFFQTLRYFSVSFFNNSFSQSIKKFLFVYKQILVH